MKAPSAMLLLCATAFAAGEQPAFLEPPAFVGAPDAAHAIADRKFQGIPSLARAPGGKLWAVWYAGKTPKEDLNNYVVLSGSADDGRTWTETLVIDPDAGGPVRAFDPEVWVDPDRRLWVFWAQAVEHSASVGGVWAITADEPDAAAPKWSAPRRLTDGVMMCKPSVLSTGEWVLPASTWRATDNSARMVVSTDRGKTWTLRGGCNVPKALRAYDEHQIVERKDGSLLMLIRTRGSAIAESVSTDRGKTWTEAAAGKLPHPSARFFIGRLASGKLLLVKHADGEPGRKRLTAYVSDDDGAKWSGGLLLDERGTISYPDGVEAGDGRIFIIYDRNRTSDREILMAVFTEADAAAGKPTGDRVTLRTVVSRPPQP